MDGNTPEKEYLILSQYRQESEYNDFLGKYYHFPKKYLRLLSHPGDEFVYFEPKKRGKGEYFGFGRVGEKIFPDQREPEYSFVEISDYSPFSAPVPFESNGTPRESAPHYNPQNAVRITTREILEEICLDGGIQLTFKADAHLMTVIGEQLIASEKVGILELVKNAYDAGAKRCTVRIEAIPSMLPINADKYRFPDLKGPVIIVEDDGKGMDRDTIENGWLRPASPLKTIVKDRIKKERERALREGKLAVFDNLVQALKSENAGRIPLGEKGIGRFAAHRLGTKLLIKTKVASHDYEYILRIDWDQFDALDAKVFTDLDSIGIALRRQPPSRDYAETKSGTQLVIYGGREGYQFSQETILDLNKTLLTLKSPFPKTSPSNFNVICECPQMVDIEERQSVLDSFPPNFSVYGKVDAEGVFKYTEVFSPPNSVPLPKENQKDQSLDLKPVEKDHWKQAGTDTFRNPECGEFDIRIDAWIRKTPWISGPDWRKFTGYLDTYGGISIFRDGLMILPAEWGAETDWLDLSKRQIKQVFRISYYNFVGNVELSQTKNLLLVDKSDRQGLLETRSFEDLKSLVRAIVTNVLEIQFRGKREQYEKITAGTARHNAGGKKPLESVEEVSLVLDRLVARYDLEKDPLQLVTVADDKHEYLINLGESLKRLEESLQQMQQVQDLLTEQAGYGLAIGVAVHEIAKITANFYFGVKAILDSGKLDVRKLEELKDASSNIKSEMNRLAPQRAIRNEPPIEFNIRKSVDFEQEVYKRRFKDLKIDFQVDCYQGFQVFVRYGAINQVISNLIDNACYWLDTVQLGNRIIRATVNPVFRTLSIADSGPNIHAVIRPYLFEPGYSMKVPPSGLGLYICKYYVTSMKGDIYLTPEKDRIKELPGAQFTIDLSRVPTSSEEAKK